MSIESMSLKRCVNCQRDVTNEQRMKDSSGRYWCISCGGEQQKKKALAGLVQQRHSKDLAAVKSHKNRLIKMLVVIGLLAVCAVMRFTDVF